MTKLGLELMELGSRVVIWWFRSNATTTTVPDLAFPKHHIICSTTATELFNFGQDSTFSGLYTQSNSYVADSNNYVGASDGNSVGSFFYTPPTGYLAICAGQRIYKVLICLDQQ